MKMRPQEELHNAVIEIQTAFKADGYYSGTVDGWWAGGSRSALATMRADAAKTRTGLAPIYGNPNAPTAEASRIFTEADYLDAATRLKRASASLRPIAELVAVVKAFKETESGTGWFTDVARINALDGAGGWLDGVALPKILFEAKWFDTFTDGKYRTSHPNLSSRTWNKALYIGGPAEWERLWKAIALDKEAALKSASVGTFQIMGFNYKLAGFDNVQAFWDAHMQGGAKAHLEAFLSFLIEGGHAKALALVTGNADTCRAIASRYNGAGYASNNYHIKIAKAYIKYLNA